MKNKVLKAVADLPAWLRHLLLLLLAALITKYAPDLLTLDLPTMWKLAIEPIVGFALAWATPLIRSYGVGSKVVSDTAEIRGEQ